MENSLFNLTSPQKSIWLTEQVYTGLPIANVCGIMTINEIIDFSLLEKALNIAVKENSATRIKIINKEGNPKQYLDKYEYFNIDIVDVSKENINQYIDTVTSRPFEINNSLLFHFELFRFEDGSGGVIALFHHLISDAWSMDLLTNITADIYYDLKNNIDSKYSFPSYVDYVNSEKEYLLSDKYLKDKTFWSDILQNFSDISTFNVLNKEKKGTDAKRLMFEIGDAQTSDIKEFCSKNKTSPYSLIITILSIYLYKISNNTNIVLGTPVLNRSNFKDKHTMGMFIGTMPFISNINRDSSALDLLNTITKDQLSYFRHQKYPYDSLLKDVRKNNNMTDNLYDILVSYQNAKNNSKDSNVDYSCEWRFNKHLTESMNIHIFDINDSGNLTFAYDYLLDIFNEEDIVSLHKRIIYIINEVINNPNLIIKNLEILTKEEKLLLDDFNNTNTIYEKNKTIHQLFEDQVLKTPFNTALICENNSLTYQELNEKANSLAHFLRSKEIGSGSIVGIMVNRSLEMIIGILAIIKTGAAYLPIDPEYPEDRIKYMLEDSKTDILLVNKKLSSLDISSCEKINISLNSFIYSSYSKEDLCLSGKPDSLIYLIYTSGSTGKPKGVMLTHKNINNFIIGMKKEIDFIPSKTMISLTTICFDIFVLEIWASLLSGMKIVLANESEQNVPSKVNSLCLKHNVDMIQTTPSRFNILLSDTSSLDYFKNLKDILVGGEPLSESLLTNFKNLTKANIYNVYGPTETAVWSTIKNQTNSSNITIGTPISNTKVYILNNDLNILPKNIPGELYISGDGVSNGYLNRVELTNEKFINSPFSDELLYNTNDLAYINNKNELVHLGRTDFQVKLRGFRIELGEIEQKILSYPKINDSIVVYDNRDFLVCYYTSNESIDTVDLLGYLLKDLPTYMAPSYFIKLDSLPLTPNGKIDRSKLPNVNIKNKVIEKATTKTEIILADIIKEITKKEYIDISSTFLELGIDSLDIINIQTSLVPYNWNITTQDFYKYPTVKLLAEKTEQKIDKKNNNTTTSKDNEIFSSVNMEKHSKEVINNDILSFDHNKNDVLGNVFLTGATGFLGIHLLEDILSTSKSKIYCLVRGNNQSHSIKRLVDLYSFYFKKDITSLIDNSIFVLNGSIDKDNLGLSKENLSKIAENTSTHIHCAAIVDHYGDFTKFKDTNIKGTKRVVDFAFKNKKRYIHISSLSVSGNYLVKQDNTNTSFTENDLFIGQHYTENVYVNSKLEAEKIVYDYISKGLQAKILRLGIVSGRFSDGIFQNNITANALYNRIKSIISISACSKSMLEQHIELTPVDYCTKSILLLSKYDTGDNKTYHLYNKNLYKIKDLINELLKFGINIDILEDIDFKKHIEYISKNNKKVLSGIVNDFNPNSDNYLNYNYSVNIKSEFTLEYLNIMNFKWPECSNSYIYKILKYMRSVNFI